MRVVLCPSGIAMPLKTFSTLLHIAGSGSSLLLSVLSCQKFLLIFVEALQRTWPSAQSMMLWLSPWGWTSDWSAVTPRCISVTFSLHPNTYPNLFVLFLKVRKPIRTIECDQPLTACCFDLDGVTMAVGSSRGKVPNHLLLTRK